MPSIKDQEKCYCQKCCGIPRSKRTVRRHGGQLPSTDTPVSLNLHQWLAGAQAMDHQVVESNSESDSDTTEPDLSDERTYYNEESGHQAKKRCVEAEVDVFIS